MRFRRILTATVVVSPRTLVWVRLTRHVGTRAFASVGCAAPGERARCTQTQPAILPDPRGWSESIRRGSGRPPPPCGTLAAVPPPYQQYPPREPPPPPPKPPRPSGWWWVLPAALFVAATALFGWVLLPVLVAPLHTDVSVPFDGLQHEAVLKGT